jgi:hypothetical protein
MDPKYQVYQQYFSFVTSNVFKSNFIMNNSFFQQFLTYYK